MSTPESIVLRACLDYLALNGIAAWRINVQGVPIAGQPGRFRPAPSKGIADIIGIGRGMGGDPSEWEYEIAVPLAIEVKSKVGRQSPAQADFARAWEAAGGVYCLVRSVDGLRAALKGAGIEVR